MAKPNNMPQQQAPRPMPQAPKPMPQPTVDRTTRSRPPEGVGRVSNWSQAPQVKEARAKGTSIEDAMKQARASGFQPQDTDIPLSELRTARPDAGFGRDPRPFDERLAEMRQRGAELARKGVENQERYFQQKQEQRAEYNKLNEAANGRVPKDVVRQAQKEFRSERFSPSSIGGIGRDFAKNLKKSDEEIRKEVRDLFKIPEEQSQTPPQQSLPMNKAPFGDAISSTKFGERARGAVMQGGTGIGTGSAYDFLKNTPPSVPSSTAQSPQPARSKTPYESQSEDVAGGGQGSIAPESLGQGEGESNADYRKRMRRMGIQTTQRSWSNYVGNYSSPVSF